MLFSTGRFFGQSGSSGIDVGWIGELSAGLLAWYKGDELTGSDADPQASWPDGSGNGSHATQATGGNRPALATSELNSLNAVYFGTSRYFEVPNIYSGKSAGSVFVVVKMDNPGVGDNTMYAFGTVDSNDDQSHYTYFNTMYDSFGTSARKSAAVTGETSWHIVNVHSAANDYGIYIDGINKLLTGTNTVEFYSAPKIGSGMKNSGLSGHLLGHVAEFVFFDGVLVQADREKVEGYLAHKWGLTGNLDAGHPYKSVAP